MGKKILCLCMALALCLSLLPATALAVGEDAPGTLWVGQTKITASGYWKTTDDGTLTSNGASADNYNVHYDGSGTLTLKDATIQGRDIINEADPIDYGIYAASTSGQSVALTINLIGSNTVKGYCGIYVGASDGDSTLVIQSDTNGSLETSGNGWNGIGLLSDSGNVSLTINNASVEASTEKAGYYGVSVKSNAGSPTISLTVNGGSLTAQGDSKLSGIRYSFQENATTPSISLTVQKNAWVKAMPGIDTAQSMASKPTPQGNGIVFDGTEGTVYGNVTLQDNLTIAQDETLTIPQGSTLNTNGNLTNNGTIVDAGGTLTGEPGGIIVTAPAITTESLPDGTVNQLYTATLQATGNGITWSASGLPAGLTLDADTGAITGTPTTDGQFQVTVTATNSVGNIDRTYTMNIKPATVSVTDLELNKDSLTLQENSSDTLIATVKPDDATNRGVTWESSDTSIATVSEDGTVTAISAGNATITATAADGSGISASCTLTVTHGNMVQTLKKDATCTADGNEEYWTCEICGKHYKDESGTIPTTPEENKIPAEGHRFSGGTCTVCGAPDPNYTPPYIPPSKPNWTSVARKLANAQPGDTVTVKMNGETEVPGDVWETIAGRDVTVILDMGGNVSWTVDGNDVPTATHFADMDFGVDRNTTGIDVDVINAITGEYGSVQITLAHDGEFGFTLTLSAPLGKENAGYWANLYHYDEEDEILNYETSAEIQEDGTASLRMTHASQYAIVIDDKSHDLPFTDLGEGQWYESAVRYAYTHDIMEGMSATTFQPNGTLTRAQAVQIFYNLEGQPDISGENLGYPYEDVNAQAWYGDAVYWARITGVATGYGDGTFQPTDSITRQEFAQMLYNYAKYKGCDLSAEGDLSQFPDSGSVADWAETAMSWANGNKLINGHDDGTIDAAGIGTRAQAASILTNLDRMVSNK